MSSQTSSDSDSSTSIPLTTEEVSSSDSSESSADPVRPSTSSEPSPTASTPLPFTENRVDETSAAKTSSSAESPSVEIPNESRLLPEMAADDSSATKPSSAELPAKEGSAPEIPSDDNPAITSSSAESPAIEIPSDEKLGAKSSLHDSPAIELPSAKPPAVELPAEEGSAPEIASDEKLAIKPSSAESPPTQPFSPEPSAALLPLLPAPKMSPNFDEASYSYEAYSSSPPPSLSPPPASLSPPRPPSPIAAPPDALSAPPANTTDPPPIPPPSPPASPPPSPPPDPSNGSNAVKFDRYGWAIDPSKALTPKELALRQKESLKERAREAKWLSMFGTDHPGNKTFRTFRKSSRRVYEGRIMKGIPDSMRSRAWLVILDRDWEGHPKRPTVDHYYKKAIPKCDATITGDLPRTMPHVQMFLQTCARDSLYRILRAYCNADRELGYFQGMAFPAALLLAYMAETEAFWAFYHLMCGKGHMLRTYYANGFDNLRLLNRAWEALLLAKYRAIALNLKKLDIEPMDYTAPWFLTAFLTVKFPPPFKLRAFDRIAAFGTRAVLSLGLAIVSLLKKELMGEKLEAVITLLQNPCEGKRLKDWRAIIVKWDKLFISKAQLAKLFKKVGLKEVT